ncbi:MAG: ornithine cyclodeaminase family protein [Candidatus Nanopelagicales bacterium]|nr:ornithine cyclodeaminase family protein [Candidatus Nanopelagicales bacterium]
MRHFDQAELDKSLTFPKLIESLRSAFAGNWTTPMRHHHGMPGVDHNGAEVENALLLMPSWTGPGSENFVGVKLVAVYPNNGQIDLPSIHGLYYLIDGNTGQPLATMDGARMTVWRTAAASALASTYLSRPESSTLTMIGTGALSPFMIRAHLAVRPITEVFLWNHNIRRAHELAEELRGQGLPVTSHPDLVTAVGKSDIVCAATLTTTPLIFGKWVKPGTHIDTVGAFTPTMRETDDELVQLASLFCDTRTGALKEGGDLAIPISQGVISSNDILADLHELTRGAHPGRTSPGEITYFKSVGTALEDLAGAIAVWQAR